MKILFVVPFDYKTVGGFKLPLVHYKKYLESVGHMVKFVPVSYKGINNNKDIRSNCLVINRELLEAHFDVIIGFSLNPCYFLAKHVITNLPYNILTVGFMMDCMFLNATSLFKNSNNLKEKIKYLIKSAVYKRREQLCLNTFRKAIFVSDVDKKFCEKSYKNIQSKLFYIPNGTDLPNNTYFSSRNRVTTIGFMSSYSGETYYNDVLPFVSNIFPVINNEFPEIRLILAGRNANEETERYLRNLPNVEFLGFVNELDEFYEKVDIVITCVKKECGLLNRILEAWSYGKVVLGYKKNFMTFLDAKENVHYLVANNASEFTKAIKDVNDGHISLNNIGKKARELVESNYSWKLCGKRLDTCIGSHDGQ